MSLPGIHGEKSNTWFLPKNLNPDDISEVGPTPVKTICPKCRVSVTTDVSSEFSEKGCLVCLFLFSTGFICCAFIPLCTMRKIEHYCPECQLLIGTYTNQ